MMTFILIKLTGTVFGRRSAIRLRYRVKARSIVTAYDIRSPEDSGSRNTKRFKIHRYTRGATKFTMRYIGRRLIVKENVILG
jgi:hypothetical protein